MDISTLLSTSIGLLICSIPAVMLFSTIFLILKYIFKVRDRILNAVITLVISLAIIFLLLGILSFIGVFNDFFVYPWTDCMSFSNCPPDYVCSSLLPLICRLIQLGEYTLIAITALVVIIPYLYPKIEGLIKKR